MLVAVGEGFLIDHLADAVALVADGEVEDVEQRSDAVVCVGGL